MASPTYTAAEIEALRDAIKGGVLSVGHGDQRVTYRSLDDMQRLLDRMCRTIESPARPLAHFARFRRD